MTDFIYNKEKVRYTPEVGKIITDNYYNSGGDLSYQLNSITVYGTKKTISGISPLLNYEFKSDQIRQGKRLEPYRSYDLISYIVETCQGLRLQESSGEGAVGRVILCRRAASASNWQVGGEWVPIVVYVDGLQENNFGALESIMMDDVEAVVYLKGIDAAPFSMDRMEYGNPTGVSAVLIKTKLNRKTLWHVSYGKPLGWQVPKKFYSPRYDVQGKDSISEGKDKRSTLYWNPKLSADKDGRVKFDFCSSDMLDGYTVTLEGVTAEGEFVSKKFQIK